MLKQLSILTVLIGGVAVAGCTTPSSSGPSPTPITTGNSTVDSAIAATVQACGYKPSAVTVAGIITQFTGGGGFVTIADQVATAICNALTKTSASRGGVKVKGVRLQGVVVDSARLRQYRASR